MQGSLHYNKKRIIFNYITTFSLHYFHYTFAPISTVVILNIFSRGISMPSCEHNIVNAARVHATVSRFHRSLLMSSWCSTRPCKEMKARQWKYTNLILRLFWKPKPYLNGSPCCSRIFCLNTFLWKNYGCLVHTLRYYYSKVCMFVSAHGCTIKSIVQHNHLHDLYTCRHLPVAIHLCVHTTLL